MNIISIVFIRFQLFIKILKLQIPFFKFFPNKKTDVWVMNSQLFQKHKRDTKQDNVNNKSLLEIYFQKTKNTRILNLD